ncbi:MAG TPA: glutamate 5-kinase [Gemmatales bacterium]|nr:glutamate 5-kinase [Gemmatales bacterium]HMP58919.1 glutamate 5-kinase [Gemmatales bacterium]
MIDPVRQEVIALAHTLVVKVGTNVLTDDHGALNPERLAQLAEQIARLVKTGRRVVLVSSGAIGAGVGLLGLGRRPTDLRRLQAAAAVGQSALMNAYADCFRRWDCPVAQVLLTASDFDDRTRYLNVRNTLHALFEWGCLPIINENDAVSVAEIKFGDNDQLAAMVTNLLQAPLLVMLTSVDGLYTGDPRVDPKASLLPTVPEITPDIAGLAGSSRSALGSGGMLSKLRAARLVTLAGECVLIANGQSPTILTNLLEAKPVGTLFLPQGGLLPARKRWIGLTAQCRGRLIVDDGARRAVEKNGRSLLPIGVVDVVGDFETGDVVALVDQAGQEFARGLSNYDAVAVRRIAGRRTEEAAALLGETAYEEVIHRDNLALVL